MIYLTQKKGINEEAKVYSLLLVAMPFSYQTWSFDIIQILDQKILYWNDDHLVCVCLKVYQAFLSNFVWWLDGPLKQVDSMNIVLFSMINYMLHLGFSLPHCTDWQSNVLRRTEKAPTHPPLVITKQATLGSRKEQNVLYSVLAIVLTMESLIGGHTWKRGPGL